MLVTGRLIQNNGHHFTQLTDTSMPSILLKGLFSRAFSQHHGQRDGEHRGGGGDTQLKAKTEPLQQSSAQQMKQIGVSFNQCLPTVFLFTGELSTLNTAEWALK